jgi:methyl-accepting chemotaxis protein
MFKNMKIGTKLSLAFLVIALIFIVAGIIFLVESRNALSKAAFNQLESVRADKKAQVEGFFAERKSDMHVLLDTVALFKQNAVNKLQSVRENKKFQIEQYFQEHLRDVTLASQSVSIGDALSQFEVAIKNATDEKSRRTTWRSVAEKFEGELRKFREERGYHHLFLIAKNGDILYSVSQGSEIGKNVLSDELKNTPLNSAFQKGSKGVAIQDFLPCVLSDKSQQILFFVAPVFQSGKLIGVLALGVTPDSINAIMQKRKGMGQTEEAYLVGKLNGQISYHSDRVVKGTDQYVVGVEKSGVDIDKALAGQSGTEFNTNNTDKIEITSYTSLNIPDINWAVLVSIALEDSFNPIREGEQDAFFTKYIAQYGYYDLFLIHPKGQIFFTVMHEAEYNTNIINGKYANSELGHLVQEVLKTKTYSISDYAPYAPSNGEPAAFIAQPLVIEGNVEMVVALQLSDTEMNEIMQQRAGMGETGESYLVGSDKLMRSNSFLDSENHSIKASFANPTVGSVDTEGTRAALAGETKTKIIKDYRGMPVLSAYTPLKVGNNTWALMVEVDKAEAFTAITRLEWVLGITALFALVVIISIAWLITRNIKQPLAHLMNISKAITAGKLDNDITVTGKDEIGQLLQAFSNMQTQLREHLEQDINDVIHAISRGDLEKRINLDNKEGFFKTLSESINQIVAFTQSVIEDIMHLFAALAQGNLTKCIENNYSGTFERLKDDANTTIVRLTEVMTKISQSAEVVNHAANEISLGNINLSQRTEQQAASLEETASSMEQMTGTVQQNADNAKEAAQLAVSAKKHAEKGGEVIGASIYAMTEINKSSQKVTEIIGVINDIAFQTNLLALNAAVEAARAGEQGRGFAVVATEVRTLAQRSAEAAKEIKGLIQESVTTVEEGTRLANQSGETLEKIVTSVKKVSDIIAEISAAGQEQSSGIAQVNKVVMQMDEMTQQNAALVEEATSASNSLKEQAHNLKEQVAFFSLDQTIFSLTKEKAVKRPVTTSQKQKVTVTTHSQPLPSYDANDPEWKEF